MHSGTGAHLTEEGVATHSVPLYMQNGNNSDTASMPILVELIVPICMYSGATSMSFFGEF